MSVEVQLIIAGYVFLVLIIVGILGFYVLADAVIDLFTKLDKIRKKKEKEKKDENKRRKDM